MSFSTSCCLISHLSVQIKAKVCRCSRNDGLVLQPFSQHKVLQLQEVLPVLGVLLQPLIVDVGQVVGAIQELRVVQRVVPILGGHQGETKVPAMCKYIPGNRTLSRYVFIHHSFYFDGLPELELSSLHNKNKIKKCY